jgi:hypothetical protein
VIDLHRLGRWMDDQGLPGRGEPIEHRFLSGSTQNEIYEISRGELRCAMRIPPPSAPAGDYYLVLAKWKFAVVLEQGFQRAGDDVKLQAFGPGPRSCTLRYPSALLPKSLERPGPKSVSPATNCSGVAVVVWLRWIVVMACSLIRPEATAPPRLAAVQSGFHGSRGAGACRGF